MAHIRGVEGVEHDDNEGGHIHVGACTGPHIYCYLFLTDVLWESVIWY